MSNIIKILPDTLANQIAAGEVIQRPASVIKELVENSIDAKATSITVNIKDGGRTLIQVTDNGIGMSPDDARLAFERHATSKISVLDDLFNINTKGFRGEALASIASVAQIELVTKQKDDQIGTLVVLEGSKIIKIENCQSIVGTNISVRNLFFNVPARRKFLKTDSTEFGHIIDEFQRIAIAHSNVELKLINNDNIVYNLPSQSLKERIVAIFENSFRKQLVDVKTDAGFINVYGYVSNPQNSTKTNFKQFFFVNNRFFRSAYFNKAIQLAYDKLMPEGCKPNYFLFFEIDPQRIDVNIHPTKTEINFEDANSIFNLLVSVIRKSLTHFDFVPSLDFENAPVVNLILQNDKKFNNKGNETFYNETNIHSQIDSLSKNKSFSENKIFDSIQSQENQSLSKQFLVLKNKYILTPVKSGVLFVELKEAFKQIKYEELINKSDVGRTSIPSIYPITLIFLIEEAKEFDKIRKELEQIGFEFLNVNEQTVNIIALPPFVKPDNAQQLILNLIHISLLTEVNVKSIEKHEIVREIVLSENYENITIQSNMEAQEIINKLFACKSHQYTFDGKLIMKILNFEEIEQLLK